MNQLAKRSELHLERKMWHIITGMSALGITFALKLDSYDASFLSFLIGLGGLLFESIRLRSEKINNLFIKFAGRVLREREKTKVSGFTYYCLGVSACFFFFPWKIAILAILFLIFSDPIASYVGILYGKRSLIFGKSLEGTGACFLACFFMSAIAAIAFLNVPWLAFALLGGLSGAIAELFAFIDDNLTIPVVSGFFLTQSYFLLV
ncbi:MAG: hypothetical protein NXH75_10560 [Halobacteriovoraceae bacterium]|nr:hypothetical protein [Halobacteriovoraceae bacterium]